MRRTFKGGDDFLDTKLSLWKKREQHKRRVSKDVNEDMKKLWSPQRIRIHRHGINKRKRVSGVAQCLGRLALAGGRSLICVRFMVDR